jgi:hypothetical protein
MIHKEIYVSAGLRLSLNNYAILASLATAEASHQRLSSMRYTD